ADQLLARIDDLPVAGELVRKALAADRAVRFLDHQPLHFFQQLIRHLRPAVGKSLVRILGRVGDHLLLGQSELTIRAQRHQKPCRKRQIPFGHRRPPKISAPSSAASASSRQTRSHPASPPNTCRFAVNFALRYSPISTVPDIVSPLSLPEKR